jgi:hypothetical protein
LNVIYHFNSSANQKIYHDWGDTIMKQNELEQLSGDELWALRVKIDEALATKLAAEKNVLERRLRQLNGEIEPERRSQASERRPYPAVLSEISQSRRSLADLGWARQAATLAESADQVWK